ncbi:MAG: hypothetical protein V4654_06105 [Bdellovibrionota bacterium]
MGHKYLIAAVSLVFLATSCGPTKNQKKEEEPAVAVSSFNSGFGGGIYFDTKESYARLDLRTGSVENFLASDRNMTSASVQGDGFVTVKRSKTYPEVLVLNRSKDAIVRIALPENPAGTPKLSRNGELVIVGGIAGDTKIFNLKGEMVENLHANVASYDWLTDGRVIFSRFGTLYITEADFKSYKVFRTLHGAPNSVTVSPDGGRIAFSMLQLGIPHIWVMDLSGTLRQVTTSTVGENFPAWSPDGNHIVLAKGKVTLKGEPNCLELWVVNANSEAVNNLNSEDLANTFRVQQNVSGQISETCAVAAPTWRAE